MNRTLLAGMLVLLVAAGCSGGKARVKGRVVESGQPMKFASNQAAIELIPIGPEEKREPSKSFTAVVNEDGSFEVYASGGELPPGNYDISFNAYGKLREKYKSPITLRRDVKAGMNDITIDLAKPGG